MDDPKPPITTDAIIHIFLDKSGFDGLLNAEVGCGCALTELHPCRRVAWDCVPSYKIPCDCGECGAEGWHMTDSKPAKKFDDS